MNDISKITVTVTVNHTKSMITVRRTGEQCPIAMSYTTGPHALAGCYRDAAAYFLDLAAGQLNRYGLADNAGIKEQAELMLYEHRNIFEEETT